jgi:hypothetical protein
MAVQTPAQLRATAAQLRGLASQGSDLRLRDALRLVADEFEIEAANAEITAILSPPDDGPSHQ